MGEEKHPTDKYGCNYLCISYLDHAWGSLYHNWLFPRRQGIRYRIQQSILRCSQRLVKSTWLRNKTMHWLRAPYSNFTSANTLAPKHYWNQCWINVYWALGNKFLWHLNKNITVFIRGNGCHNAIACIKCNDMFPVTSVQNPFRFSVWQKCRHYLIPIKSLHVSCI